MRLLVIMLLLSFSIAAYSQTGTTINGRVQDKAEKPVEGVNATLLTARDSSTIATVATSREGAYQFLSVAPGTYKISFTAIGFKPIISPAFPVAEARKQMQLPAVTLQPLTAAMKDVTVSASRLMVEQKIDRTIVNVDASITNAGSSAMDVLERSPGVVVDKDGNISLKGKDGVMVMVDGRPTQLGGADLANLLRNMNASQMDIIEIMPNPPAKYDAAGNAGIINIKTKKNKQVGYNGAAAINYTQGRYAKFNESFNFNYRAGKVNLFTNLSHNYSKDFETLTIQRRLLNTNTLQIENFFDQEANKLMQRRNYNGKIGMDYFLNKRTTMGVVVSGFSSPTSANNINQANIANRQKELQSITRAAVNNTGEWKSFTTNFYTQTVLDSTGKELTTDFDYMKYNSRNNQFIVNTYLNANNYPLRQSDSLQGSLPQNITIYSGRVDYLHPLKKGARFEAGIKSSIVRTDNDAVYDSIQSGLLVRDIGRSNHFVYEENINAAYINVSGSLTKKINVQVGLRVENTNAKGYQITTGQTFNRNYTQLFPTAYFQYKADASNNFGFNYGKRIRRPNYESLNPFIRFIDRYTYSQGNPNLKPQFSHNIELSHTYKNFLTTTFNYTATTDIMQTVVEQKGQEAYTMQSNIASLHQVGLSLSANKAINKWWTASLFANVYNNDFNGIVNNTPISLSATRLVLNTTHQFKLTKTLAAELSGGFRSAGLEGVLATLPIGTMSAGFSKQVMKNKGTIKLTVRDIFYTLKMRANINYGNVDASFQEVRDSRVVNLGFSFRFGKGKVANVKKKTAGSATDEQNRVDVN